MCSNSTNNTSHIVIFIEPNLLIIKSTLVVKLKRAAKSISSNKTMKSCIILPTNNSNCRYILPRCPNIVSSQSTQMTKYGIRLK